MEGTSRKRGRKKAVKERPLRLQMGKGPHISSNRDGISMPYLNVIEELNLSFSQPLSKAGLS